MKNRNLKLIILLLTVVALLWGCGSGAASNLKADASLMEGSMPAEKPSADLSKPGANLPEGRKLIRRVSIEAQTKDMDTLLPQIEAQVHTLGGYLESREVYSGSNDFSQWRNARLTIRIPSDKADQFLSEIDAAANVLSLNETLTDVTLDYIATESRINALRAEQDRLLELLDQAKSLSEVLEIEARLTDVIGELESVESQKRLYDNQIDYTSIQLSVRQVTELSTPEDEMTVWERISTGFMATLTGMGETFVDLFVWLIASSPALVVLGIAVFAVYKLIRFLRKRKQK